MPFDVKMPQLGMNQDSAVIVAWLKSEGDRVEIGDALFEVETDKATMEVEAAAEGFLAGIRAGEGTDVPVGDVIALIVESEDDVADHAAAKPPAPQETPDEDAGPEFEASPPPEDKAPEPAKPAPEEKVPAAPAVAPAVSPAAPRGGRVLASPKARRLAAERGLDLSQLRAQGIAEPIHAADLASAGAAGGQSALGARVDTAAFDALLSRSEAADRTALFAAFAAGAWRALFGEDDLAVAVRGIDGSVSLVANPDRGGRGEAQAATLAVVDLCETRLGSYAPAGGGITLSAARDGSAVVLTLSFSEGALPMPHAVALLDDIAARVENPIRQLL